MLEFLKRLFSADFMPHGHCYQWDAGVMSLHVISDGLITLAYYSIPITLAYFIWKRRDLPFSWMFAMFAGFIVACGTTHLIEIWTVWHGTYRLAGAVKAITAALSVSTAFLLVRVMPTAMALSAATDSTERSMWPDMMTSANPIDMTPSTLDASMMLAKMPSWK